MATVILSISYLTVVSNFGHSEVPSSPSRNLFGILRSPFCPVLRGIVTVSITNHIALHANVTLCNAATSITAMCVCVPLP